MQGSPSGLEREPDRDAVVIRCALPGVCALLFVNRSCVLLNTLLKRVYPETCFLVQPR